MKKKKKKKKKLIKISRSINLNFQIFKANIKYIKEKNYSDYLLFFTHKNSINYFFITVKNNQKK
jgi:hypothetical protein